MPHREGSRRCMTGRESSKIYSSPRRSDDRRRERKKKEKRREEKYIYICITSDDSRFVWGPSQCRATMSKDRGTLVISSTRVKKKVASTLTSQFISRSSDLKLVEVTSVGASNSRPSRSIRGNDRWIVTHVSDSKHIGLDWQPRNSFSTRGIIHSPASVLTHHRSRSVVSNR